MALKHTISKRYRQILGMSYPLFERSIDSHSSICIRANTIKTSSPQQLRQRLQEQGFSLAPISWCPGSFTIQNPSEMPCMPAKTLEHQLGYFFIQSASSMLPPLALAPQPGDVVLDACAAPGAKTTQLSALMQNSGLIIATDISYGRINALQANIQRMCCSNVAVFNHDVQHIKGRFQFQKILLDAPCTGTGRLERISIMRAPKILGRLSRLQFSLLASTAAMLEKGGSIVYSTCSLEPEENELVVQKAVDSLGLKVQSLPVKGPFSPAVMEWDSVKFDKSISKCARILPFEGMEGFFIARLSL